MVVKGNDIFTETNVYFGCRTNTIIPKLQQQTAGALHESSISEYIYEGRHYVKKIS